MSATDVQIPIKITTDVQPGSPGAKTSEFYITLLKGLAGLTLGTGWVTGHQPVVQVAGIFMALIVGLAYLYSRHQLKLAVLAPVAEALADKLLASSTDTTTPALATIASTPPPPTAPDLAKPGA